jgi:hypothetical protein
MPGASTQGAGGAPISAAGAVTPADASAVLTAVRPQPSASNAALEFSVFRALRTQPGKSMHWGAPLATRGRPPGEPELAEAHDARGHVISTMTVYRQELSDEQGVLWFVPQPEPGWERVKVRGEQAVEWSALPDVPAFAPAN